MIVCECLHTHVQKEQSSDYPRTQSKSSGLKISCHLPLDLSRALLL